MAEDRRGQPTEISGPKLVERWGVKSCQTINLNVQKYERQRARDHARHKRRDP